MTDQENYMKLYNRLRSIDNNLYNAISKMDSVYNSISEAVQVNHQKIDDTTIITVRQNLTFTRNYIKNYIIDEVNNKMV